MGDSLCTAFAADICRACADAVLVHIAKVDLNFGYLDTLRVCRVTTAIRMFTWCTPSLKLEASAKQQLSALAQSGQYLMNGNAALRRFDLGLVDPAY